MSTRYKIGDTEVTEEEFKAECAANPGPVVVIGNAEAFYRSLEQNTQRESLGAFDDAYARMHDLVTGNAAVLAERERCAKIADAIEKQLEAVGCWPDQVEPGFLTAKRIAEVIRNGK